jgi:hypothetical protein
VRVALRKQASSARGEHVRALVRLGMCQPPEQNRTQLTAEGHDPLFVPLASDGEEQIVQVHLAPFKGERLGDPESCIQQEESGGKRSPFAHGCRLEQDEGTDFRVGEQHLLFSGCFRSLTLSLLAECPSSWSHVRYEFTARAYILMPPGVRACSLMRMIHASRSFFEGVSMLSRWRACPYVRSVAGDQFRR